MNRMTAGLGMGCWIAVLMGTIGGHFPLFGQGAAPGADQMFQGLDTNKDSQLSLADVQGNNRAILADILKMAGKPTTGTVSRTEFDKVHAEHQARSGGGNRPPNTGRPTTPPPTETERPEPESGAVGLSDALLKLCDTNGDGRLTRLEWNRLPSLWARLDANSDGVLDEAERAAIGEASPPPRSGAATPAQNPQPRTGTSPRPTAAAVGLNGVWRGWVVRGTGEDPNGGEMEMELTINGNKIDGKELSTNRAPGGLGSGTYTMTGNAKSGTLDSEQTTGPQAGRTYIGTYEVTGDTLKWCVTGRNRTRPATMATDRGNYLLILKRQP